MSPQDRAAQEPDEHDREEAPTTGWLARSSFFAPPGHDIQDTNIVVQHAMRFLDWLRAGLTSQDPATQQEARIIAAGLSYKAARNPLRPRNDSDLLALARIKIAKHQQTYDRAGVMRLVGAGAGASWHSALLDLIVKILSRPIMAPILPLLEGQEGGASIDITVLRVGLDGEYAEGLRQERLDTQDQSPPSRSCLVPATQPDRLEEDVERAFDLLIHYRGLLQAVGRGGDDADRHALAGLECVLRQWLPLALPASVPVITQVLAVLGNYEAATRALANVDFGEARLASLQELAGAAFPSTMSPDELTRRCRGEIRRWRDLLPAIGRKSDGQRAVDAADRVAAQAVGQYWSSGIERRPSRLGASLRVAAACDGVAMAARRAAGIPTSAIRPAIRLAHRLRESPDWTQVDEHDLLAVLDEQAELARDVEELLAELDLALVPVPQGEHVQSHVAATRQLHQAVKQIAGGLSNVRTLIDRYAETSLALAILDHHAQGHDGDPEPNTPERAASWRTLITDIQKHLADARQLWESPAGSGGSHLGLQFSRGGHAHVKCGPIERNSYHEVFIAVGRLILDPSDAGGIWDNELASDGVLAGSATNARPLARLHVVRALESRGWWTEARLGLEREIADRLSAPSGRETQALSEVVPQEGEGPARAPAPSSGTTTEVTPSENTTRADGRGQLSNPTSSTWENLSPKQQAVILWVLSQPRGDTFTRSQILENADGIHNKGDDRVVIDQLVDLGLLRTTDGKRPQLRLARIPARTPSTLPRHASWSDP